MSNRAIRLSRIHALNWYGYQDSLPVQGNLVLAGLTGSGKSILMDLIMLVLVGPERARHHFNRSATGAQSDRTLKSYCLLDTKREENGQPQFFRDKGGTTYVALEFTWPDGKRVETWGLRIEFFNASENEGHIKPFFCKGALERGDFLESLDHGKKRPRDAASFSKLIEARSGRLFASSREYARDMANGAHLNFNRDVLDRLLPSAMSFTNLKSFDDFCRRFVLPSEEVAVEDVTASYRDFLSYKDELTQLRIQEQHLQNIHSLGKQLHDAERDRDVACYLAVEIWLEHAANLVRGAESRLAQLREAAAVDDARLKEIEQHTAYANSERDRLNALLHETPEGRLFDDLTRRTKELEEKITGLQNLSSRVEDRLHQRVNNARAWLQQAKKAAVKPGLNTDDVEHAIREVESSGTGHTFTALGALRHAALQFSHALRQSIQEESKQLVQLRRQQEELETQITALKHGLPPIGQPVLHAINAALPRLPGQPPAQALRELCEVADEAWREAIEVVFTEKFAVIVADELFDEALRAYEALQPQAQGKSSAVESLLHPEKVAALSCEVLPGSLAEKIEASHPVARAFINHWFGRMICCQTLEQFRTQPGDAILPDGFAMRGAVLQRASHYDGVPFVGKRGLKKQLDIKSSLLKDVEAGIRRLAPVEEAMQRVVSNLDHQIPDHASMAQDLSKLEQLPDFEKDLEKLRKNLQSIHSAEFEEMARQVEGFQKQIASLGEEKFNIATQGKHREIEEMDRHLASRRKEADDRERAFAQVKLQLDVSIHLERLRSWREDMRQKYLVADAVAREFERAQTKANDEALRAEGDLKQAMSQFKNAFHPRFDDFPQDGRSLAPYEKVLERIAGASIPEYEAKAEQEKTHWERLFRTQVLSRMQAALKRVEDIIFLLNQQLKHPIGRDRYHIKHPRNPEFKIYRDLIDLNVLHEQDSLFFQSVSGELRDALEGFLNTLVNKANSLEAARLLDYRQYFDYKLFSSDVSDPEATPIDVDRQSGKMSGGENQSPYFVAILASYLHAYNRHEKRWKEPSLALVPIDEAFSKLSGERIQDCIAAVGELDLQGVFSMSSGNIPYAFSLCDELIVVTKREERRAGKGAIRNVPSVLLRDTPEGKEWMAKHGA